MENLSSKVNNKAQEANIKSQFIKNVLQKRLLMLVIMTLSISFPLAILIQMLFYLRYQAITLLALALIFLIINTVRFSRWFYLSVAGDSIYYKGIIAIHIIFAIINIICSVFIPNIVYSWFFLLAKFLKFIIPGTSGILSIIVFHGLLLLTALVSPLSVKWIVIEEKTAPKINLLDTEDKE